MADYDLCAYCHQADEDGPWENEAGMRICYSCGRAWKSFDEAEYDET